MVSPAARLFGFVLLLAIMFAGAYLAGARVGPLAITHAPPAPGAPMQMGTGSGPAAPRTAGLPSAGAGR